MRPEMEYLGYTYEVEYDDDPDDCTRKFWHIVRDSKGHEVKGENWGPYHNVTFDEFKQFVIDHIVASEQPEITSEIHEFYMMIERDRGNVRS